MAELCTWAHFSLTDIEHLQECSSNREVLKQAMCEKLKLGLDGAEITKQHLIEIDLHVYTFLFGLKQSFSTAQLSALLSIVKKVHEMCVSTVFDNQPEVLSYFQELVVQHSVNRPPFSICIFSPNEVKNINEYVLSTYFKHFKLYKYAFTRKVNLNMTLLYGGEEIQPERESDQDATLEPTQEIAVEEDEGDVSEAVGEEHADRDTEPVKSHVKELINIGLTKIVQQEQDRLQLQLAAQETKLLSRISTLEAVVDAKRPGTNSGKKKGSKTAH